MKNKPELTFYLSEEKTADERYQDIQDRNERIKQELVNLHNAWGKFKEEMAKIEKKSKDTDKKVYTICLGGIFVCTLLLLILEMAK